MAWPRRKELTLDLIDMDADQTVDLGSALTSPLSLLSPNALHAKPSRSPAVKGTLLASSPSLPGGERAFRRRPDPRRQSSAIFAGFARATDGAGLLDDDEIAVGDDDILISLPKAAKSQVAGPSHSHVWLEPHTDELLSGELPEPQFGSMAGHGLETIPESAESHSAHDGIGGPVPCNSPVRRVSPVKRAGSRAACRVDSPDKLAGRGVRDSTSLTEGLSKMCLEAGLLDYDDADFMMQDGNKVKEMALLFKIEADTLAVTSPKADSATSSRHAADCGAVPLSDTADSAAPGCSVRARVQQLQSTAKPAAPKEVVRQKAAKPQLSASKPAGTALPSSRAGGTGSKPAVPAARPSRLRPPSTSSSYFSHTVTESRASVPADAQQRPRPLSASRTTASARAVAPPRASSALRPPGAVVSRSGPAAASSSSAASSSPARSTISRPSTAPPPPRSSPAMSRQAGVASTSDLGMRGQPVRSRLAQSSSLPAPSPLRGAAQAGSASTMQMAATQAATAADQPRRGTFNQHTVGAAASRLRPPTAPSSGIPSRAAPQEPSSSSATSNKLPKLRLGSPLASPSSNAMTPNTARIRFLEQHPELVFGGGTKIGNSPTGQAEGQQPVRRKTAEERHLEEWDDML